MRIRKFNNSKIAISTLVVGLFFGVAGLVWGGTNDNIKRWAWNAMIDPSTNADPTGLGWLSTNCRNDFDNDGIVDDRCKNSAGNNVSYGLKVNLNNTNATALGSFTDGTADYVQGCAWSALFGWVCFDQDPTYCPPRNTINTADTACAKLSNDGVKIEKDLTYPFYYLKSSVPISNNINLLANADARAVVLNLSDSLTEAQSYIGFPFNPASGKIPGLGGHNLTGKVSSCFGCKTADGGNNDKCDVCYLVNDGLSDPTIAPNPNIMCAGCTRCNATVRGGSCGNSNNTCDVTSCAQCYTQPGVVVNYYGVCQNNGTFCVNHFDCGAGVGSCSFNKAPAELCGWGFNAAQTDVGVTPVVTKGLGWIAFNPAVYGKATPYVTGQQGSIYSGGNITQPLAPPRGKANATYLIDAKGTITRWTSSSSPTYVRPNLSNTPSFLGYDTTSWSGQATSTIGNIDIKGLITAVGGGSTNKYGSLITSISGTGTALQEALNTSIAGRVLVVGSLVTINPPVIINESVILKPGSLGLSGSGVVYINGDLNINKNITYAPTPVTRLKYIPSLVWIVRGDVTIEPGVTSVAGTFIVLGDGDPNDCPAIISSINPPASNGCGRFSTGNDKTLPTPNQLTVYGHVVAKQFSFQRSYSAVDSKKRAQPAEIFIADGRIQANPPAGLSELSRSLPKFNFTF